MKILLILFLPILAYGQQQCCDDFWKQSTLVGKTKNEFTLEKGQAFKPLIFERGDTTIRKTYIITEKETTTPEPVILSEIIDDTPSPANLYMLNATTPYIGTVNANPPDWTKWTHFKDQSWNANFHNKTATFGFATNSYLQVTWTGFKIEWYAEKKSDHGIAAVSIDGGPEVDVDLYKNSNVNGSELAYTWTAPTQVNATHTIRIKVKGTKNPAASQTNISHDYFKVFKVQ